jgi:ribosome biogenesis protein Tsr3
MKWKGMMDDKLFDNIITDSKEKAELIIIKRIKEMFISMNDKELINEFGVIVWEE